jgi:hypothetical protein
MADSQTAARPAVIQPQQVIPGAERQPEKPGAQDLSLPSLLEQIVDDETKRLLVAQETERRTFNNNWRIAGVLSASGFFKDTESVERAMAKIEIGRSWGLNAADAMRYVVMINGKPGLENELIASRLRQAGWDWEPQFIGGEGATCRGVRLFISRDGKPFLRTKRNDDGTPVVGKDGSVQLEQVAVEFTEAQAKLIKVYESGKQITILEKKGPWSEGYRGNMYYWKCIGQFRRFYASGVLCGALMLDELREIEPASAAPVALAALRGEIEESTTRTATGSTRQPASVFGADEKPPQDKPQQEPAAPQQQSTPAVVNPFIKKQA